MEVNPGPDSKLRFDYIATAADITHLIEDVMRDTERLVIFYLNKKAQGEPRKGAAERP